MLARRRNFFIGIEKVNRHRDTNFINNFLLLRSDMAILRTELRILRADTPVLRA